MHARTLGGGGKVRCEGIFVFEVRGLLKRSVEKCKQCKFRLSTLTLSAVRMCRADLFGRRIYEILLYGKRMWHLFCSWLTRMCSKLKNPDLFLTQPAQEQSKQNTVFI